ncbi:MAG: GNAT family N-acetyltransferase [bacterium]|nr:GNAT family N-acetyltransferase [bacterium]
MPGNSGDISRFTLVSLDDRHLRRRAEFANDPELRRLFGFSIDGPRETLDSERRWFSARIAAGDVLLAIEVDGQYVGDIDVFFPRGGSSAEFTLVIGDARFRGVGIGTEVVQRVLQWLFVGEPQSLGTPPHPVSHVDVDTEPGRNPLAHRFWLKQGFEFDHMEDNLQWLRLTREAWLARRVHVAG